MTGCSCGAGPKLADLGYTYQGRPITCCRACWWSILQLIRKERGDAPVRVQ